jgi:hypothetical protein
VRREKIGEVWDEGSVEWDEGSVEWDERGGERVG